MIRQLPVLPRPDVAWFDQSGRPTQVFYEYARAADQAMRELINAENARS